MAAATMYVTVAGAGDNSGSSWGNAMGYSEWEADMKGFAEAGDIYYVAGGTYTLTNDMSTALDGTTTNPIRIIGVKSGTTNEPPVYSDWAFTTDRPLIACGAYAFIVDNFWKIANLQFTLSGFAKYLRGDNNVTFINCKSTHTHATLARAFHAGGYAGVFIDCEAISTKEGIYCSYATNIVSCYVHDCGTTGIHLGSTYMNVLSSVIDSCGIGINMVGSSSRVVKNNIIYNCTTGISGTTYANDIFVNNIIDSCTTGALQSAERKSNFWDYNCWNNTSDISNVTKGDNAVTADPSMTAPADGDFTLQSGSPCLDAGMQVGTNQGATGDYKWNIGADQGDETWGRKISKEDGAKARGGAGSCVKFIPTSTTAPASLRYYIPVDNSNTTVSLYHMYTVTGFDGTGRVVISDVSGTAGMLINGLIVGGSSTAYVKYTTSGFTPSATGLCEVTINWYNGAGTSGGVYVDDITVP